MRRRTASANNYNLSSIFVQWRKQKTTEIVFSFFVQSKRTKTNFLQQQQQKTKSFCLQIFISFFFIIHICRTLRKSWLSRTNQLQKVIPLAMAVQALKMQIQLPPIKNLNFWHTLPNTQFLLTGINELMNLSKKRKKNVIQCDYTHTHTHIHTYY